MEAIEKNPLMFGALALGAFWLYSKSKRAATTAKVNPTNSGLGAIFPQRPVSNKSQPDPWSNLLGAVGFALGGKIASAINTPANPDSVLTGSPPMYNSDNYSTQSYGAPGGNADDSSSSPIAVPNTNSQAPSDLMNFWG